MSVRYFIPGTEKWLKHAVMTRGSSMIFMGLVWEQLCLLLWLGSRGPPTKPHVVIQCVKLELIHDAVLGSRTLGLRVWVLPAHPEQSEKDKRGRETLLKLSLVVFATLCTPRCFCSAMPGCHPRLRTSRLQTEITANCKPNKLLPLKLQTSGILSQQWEKSD